VLRILSLLLASFAVPFGYLAARRALGDERLASFVPIALAALPGLMIDVCRVANDSLAIALTSALLAVMLGVLGPGMWILLGVILGALLLTKAFALVFLGLAPLVVIAQDRKNWKTASRRGVFSLAVALAMAGWWYWNAWLITGTISGEQIDAAASRFGFAEKVLAIARIDWWRILDAAAYTHIWIGGWSFLVLRSWMYRVFEAIAVCAGIGLVAGAWKGSMGKRILLVGSQFGFFCASVVYHVVVIYLAGRPPTALGWYFNIVIAAEVILILSGLLHLVGKRWIGGVIASVICVTLCLDLYAMNCILIPYHAGSFPGWLRFAGGGSHTLWILYLAASIGLAVLAVRQAQEIKRTSRAAQTYDSP
jgi:hypothetical protein